MKKLISDAVALTALASMLAFSVPVGAAALTTAPGQNKLLCFDGTTDGGFGGVCTLASKGAKGAAMLDNTDSTQVDYSGVYIENTTMAGQLLSNITQLSYTYSGTTVPTLGDLSLNLPVSTDGDNVNDYYLFIDAYNCAGVGGVVNVISDPNCGIVVGSPEIAFYPNWATLVAANPTWKVGTTGSGFVGTLPFIIAERTATEDPALWTVSNVKLGKGGK